MRYRQSLASAIPHSPSTVLWQYKEGYISEEDAHAELLRLARIANARQSNALGNMVQAAQAEATQAEAETRIDRRPRQIKCAAIRPDGCTVAVYGGPLSFPRYYRISNGSPSALRIGRALGAL